MDLKGIFIKSDEPTEKAKEPVQAPSTSNLKFPSANETAPTSFGFPSAEPNIQPSFSYTPTTPVNTGSVPQEFIDKALSIYQQGFDSMNQPGFDFYEYHQLVLNGGAQNAPVYSMAFSMSNGMDKTITKEKLIQGADYYINEINNQFNGYVAQGNTKKQGIEGDKTRENESLLNEVETIKQQMEALKIQLEDRQRKLAEIGNKYQPQLNEIEYKQQANIIAKDRVLSTIEQVKQGIINNLK